jgi:hypothetical protein
MPEFVIEYAADNFSEQGEEKQQGFWGFLWGIPAENSINLGMWSYHFIDNDDSYRTTHNLIAITYKGIFGGTFENSKDDRTWTAGVQRDVYRTNLGVLSVDMGYRLGLMYGYDKMEIFNSGIFPLLQVYSNLRYKRVGRGTVFLGRQCCDGRLYFALLNGMSPAIVRLNQLILHMSQSVSGRKRGSETI